MNKLENGKAKAYAAIGKVEKEVQNRPLRSVLASVAIGFVLFKVVKSGLKHESAIRNAVSAK